MVNEIPDQSKLKRTETAEPKKKRTRKVGGLRAFVAAIDGPWLQPVENWPDKGPTTRDEAKKLYVSLKLTGRVELLRDAGAPEAEPTTIMRFK